MKSMRTTATIFATIVAINVASTTFCGSLPGQKLRRAVAAADLVIVAKSVRVIPAKNHVIHRVAIEEVLRGPVNFSRGQKIAVVVTKMVSQHNKPVAAKSMLMCLHDIDRSARKAGLPENFGPYFKMSGHPGSAVVLEEKPANDHRLGFARVLIASQKGQSSRKTSEALFAIAMRGDKRVRIEAAHSVTERPVLLGYLTQLHLSNILARAVGESEDIPYKIVLASICAERKVPDLIPSLCLSVEHVGDESFLRALGRFAAYIHKEDAVKVVMPHVQRARGVTKNRMIFALGATSTEAALEALLKMHRRGANKTAVEAALRVHGSPRAAAAIAREKSK